MRKDDDLERAFDEYFSGVEKPEGLAEDAKKLNTKRKPLWAAVTKYASALACVLVVCIVAFVGIYSSLAGGGGTDEDDGTDYSASTETYYATYSLSSLTSGDIDPYSAAQTNSALNYIQTFAYASNAAVTSCTGYSDESGLVLVKAEVTVSSTYNQQTVIYVEFTEDGYICDELTSYYDLGATSYYGNTVYLSYVTEDNGEPVRCMVVENGGARYYIRVTSRDESAYKDYLYLLIG